MFLFADLACHILQVRPEVRVNLAGAFLILQKPEKSK